MSSDPLTSPSRVRELLAGLDVKPSRAMGQNFLVDANILRILVEAAQLQPDDQVLEIGPGLGVVTRQLLLHVARVVAIEKDKRLAGFLADDLKAGPGLTLLCQDALQADLPGLLASGVNKVVSNLPYSVGSRLLIDLAEAPTPPALMVVTVQEEVAQRLAADVGTHDYGLLSVRVQMGYRVRILKKVSASCFWPVPKIASTIVLMEHAPRQDMSPAQQNTFRSLTKAAFAHRRKQMAGILAHYGPGAGLELDEARRLLSGLGLNVESRPGDLDAGAWAALANVLTSPV